MYSVILFCFSDNSNLNWRGITLCDWMKVFRVLFYPTNCSSYIMSWYVTTYVCVCVRFLKLKMKGRTVKVWVGDNHMSWSAGVWACVHMHVCVCMLFLTGSSSGFWSCGQQEEVNIAGSCFLMKNLLSEKQSNGLLLNKTAVTAGPASLVRILGIAVTIKVPSPL